MKKLKHRDGLFGNLTCDDGNEEYYLIFNTEPFSLVCSMGDDITHAWEQDVVEQLIASGEWVVFE